MDFGIIPGTSKTEYFDSMLKKALAHRICKNCKYRLEDNYGTFFCSNGVFESMLNPLVDGDPDNIIGYATSANFGCNQWEEKVR